MLLPEVAAAVLEVVIQEAFLVVAAEDITPMERLVAVPPRPAGITL